MGLGEQRMSLSEARTLVERRIDEELRLAEDGEANLDPSEIQALGVAAKVLGDVMHADVAQYLDDGPPEGGRPR